LARRLGKVATGGGTAAGAAQAAHALEGVSALISFGLAGGLDPALPPGALAIPAAVLLDGEPVPTDPVLTRRFGGPTIDRLLAGDTVVTSAAEKERLFAESGAAAVDLETGAVLRAARARGLPFAVLRAVCDPASRDLPPAALAALDPAGGIGLLGVLRALARQPAQLGALFALGRDASAARRSLLRLTML
jgi:adenosylhomocysteine nucleosidase